MVILFLTFLCPNSQLNSYNLINSTQAVCFHLPIIYKLDLAAPLNSTTHDSFFQRATYVVTQIKHVYVSSSLSVEMLSKHPVHSSRLHLHNNTQCAFQPLHGCDLKAVRNGKNKYIYTVYTKVKMHFLFCNIFSLLGYLLVEPVGCGLREL